jgi:hypothetical protein
LYCANDENIYAFEINSNEYNIYKLDFNFNTVNKSFGHSCGKHKLYVSVYNDILYFCEINDDDINSTNISVHTHDVDTLKLYHVYVYEDEREYETYYLDETVYQNKLYEYVRYHRRDKIRIYDLVTMERIHSFDIDDRYLVGDIKLSIADDILMISDKRRTLFYDIK